MYSVYQHWDPLDKVIVGRTYPPGFYHWIKDSKTRQKFEKMAQETEEDYQKLIDLLTKKFSVNVCRPHLPDDFASLFVHNRWVLPPTAPRDYFLMIHDKFWVPKVPNASHAWSIFYRQCKNESWPDFVRPKDFYQSYPKQALSIKKKFDSFQIEDQKHLDAKLKFYSHIFEDIQTNGNEIVETDLDFVNGCFVSRIGQDLYFGTQTYHDDQLDILDKVNQLWPDTKNHVVTSAGHGDAVYCAMSPGLIISTYDIPTYADTFPGWEVIRLTNPDFAKNRKFEHALKINKGRWFIPGFEKDVNLQQIVDHYFNTWVGQVSETVFSVNILIVDPKNIIMSSHHDQVEDACARHGINVHVVPFRHRYFWDAGTHCITNDLNRRGQIQSYFSAT